MHFWLKRGACGYRMDVINLISKDQNFPDAPETSGPGHKYHSGFKYFCNGPRMHEYLQAMYTEVLAKYDAITVGEMPGIDDINEVIRSVGAKAGELNMIFIFDIVMIDCVPGAPSKYHYHKWDVSDIRRIITKWQRAMIEHDGWNSVFVENHDNPRSVSRYTDDSDAHRVIGAKLLALMQTTLAGTLYVYQGEELGMRNVPKTWDIDTEFKDIESVNQWQKVKTLYADDPAALAQARDDLWCKARDNSRTPIPWTPGPNAGFCDEGVKPWMRVNDDWQEFNAERELADPDSVLHFWQHCLKARKMHKETFVYGDYEDLTTKGDKVFAYLRTGTFRGKPSRALAILNFSGEEVEWEIPEKVEVDMWALGNYRKEVGLPKVGKVTLRAWEGVLGRCK
jgi:oligo-1,6-glucosidase